MLPDVYLYAIRNKDKELSSISENNSKNRSILLTAKGMWIDYQPVSKSCVIAGVDSSYNMQHFQGFHLYVIDAACVTKEGNILAKEFIHKIGVLDRNQLEAKSLEIETNIAYKANNNVNLILVDGSLISRFVSVYPSVVKSVMDLIKEYRNIVFISKTSDSREIFKHMNSKVGDIYFFNHISSKAGYSKPHIITRYKESITVVYARLSDFTPLIKLEFPREITQQKVKGILDQLAYDSVSGYPYVLKLAHNTVVVSDNDIERLAGIYGLKNEFGAREVLRK